MSAQAYTRVEICLHYLTFVSVPCLIMKAPRSFFTSKNLAIHQPSAAVESTQAQIVRHQL